MLVAVVACALVAIIIWFYWQQTFFKRHNLPYVQTNILLGGLSDSLLGKCGFFENVSRLYKSPEVKNATFFGFFIFQKPALVIRDPELIKRIMVKDFNSFNNRVHASYDSDPLGKYNLIYLKNPVWKNLREKLTPFFSSGKLKLIFYIMDKVSSDLTNYIFRCLDKEDKVELDVREVAAMYTTDVIANTAYGLDAKTLENSGESEFRRVGRQLYTFDRWSGLGRFFQAIRPELARLIGYKRFDDDSSNFIRANVGMAMKERAKSGVRRNDLIDILLELKKMDIKDFDGEIISDDVLYAQAAVFFIAGFETSSSTQSFAMYEMVRNSEVQERVREEIKEMLLNHDGKVTYEGVMNETPFLHQVVLETLRLYPVVSWIDRECTNPEGYSLEPLSSFKIPYKMPVFFPVYPLHRDEKFYPEPESFNPDRFGPENKDNLVPYTFLGFGAGSRLCIGERFGILQVKVGIVKVLKEFRLEKSPSTPAVMKVKPKAAIIQPDKPLLINFVKDSLL